MNDTEDVFLVYLCLAAVVIFNSDVKVEHSFILVAGYNTLQLLHAQSAQERNKTHVRVLQWNRILSALNVA